MYANPWLYVSFTKSCVYNCYWLSSLVFYSNHHLHISGEGTAGSGHSSGSALCDNIDESTHNVKANTCERTIDSVCNLSCAENHRIDASTDRATVTCKETGWEPEIPTCIGKNILKLFLTIFVPSPALTDLPPLCLISPTIYQFIEYTIRLYASQIGTKVFVNF